MGLGWDGLLATVDADKQHALLAAQGKIASLKAREVELNAFEFIVQRGHHASVDVVMQNLTHVMRPNRLVNGRHLAVKQGAHASQCLHTDDFLYRVTHP